MFFVVCFFLLIGLVLKKKSTFICIVYLFIVKIKQRRLERKNEFTLIKIKKKEIPVMQADWTIVVVLCGGMYDLL